MITDIKLFGNKNYFAIELKRTKNSKKFYLRFWIQNLPMGAFTKSAELDFSINTFKKIIQKKESMYLPVFDGKTAEEIYKYTKDIDFDKDEDVFRFEQLEPLYKLAFFGPQFTNTSSTYLVLYKNEKLHFVWQNDSRKALLEAKIFYSDFCKVFEEYIAYSNENKLA